MKEPFLVREAILRLRRRKMACFNTPGHRQGLLYHGRAPHLDLWADDFTEPAGVLPPDYLPGAVKRAEEELAEGFGAQWCSFLYNGATAGVLAMLLGALRPGGRILLPRNVHFSVVSGLIAAGAEPVFLYPRLHPRFGVPEGIPLSLWREALDRTSGLSAVFITNPSYQGICFQLKEICRLAHEKGLPVLVDEAHGALLSLDPEFENSARNAGADCWVQSLHKNLGAPTQTGVLCGRGESTVSRKIRAALKMVQSSSPSYPILAGLEFACRAAQRRGLEFFKKAVENAAGFKYDIIEKKLPLEPISAEETGWAGVAGFDPARVCLSAKECGLSGREIAAALAVQGICPEYYEGYNVLFLFNASHRKREVKRLTEKLARIVGEKQASAAGAGKNPPAWGPLVVSPVQAFHSRTREAPLKECAGLVSAQIAAPYPPGMPVLIPGERITPEQAVYLQGFSGEELVMAPETGSTGRLLVVDETA